MVKLEIVYGNGERQFSQIHHCSAGTTIATVLDQITFEINDFNWRDHALGIFSKLTAPETQLFNDCRIEIYQALIIDPKQARLKRAQRATIKKA